MNGTEDGKARNNKLEYFLKKNLHPNVYSNIRWYEAVIVRTGNTLAYKQVVVCGEDIYLTETPPRSLTHLLHSSHLTHVQLVHDLPEFLRGGVRDQTTHITLKYRPSHTNSLGKSKSGRRNSNRPAPRIEPSTSSIDEENEDIDVNDGSSLHHPSLSPSHPHLPLSPSHPHLPLSPAHPHPSLQVLQPNHDDIASVYSDPSPASLHLRSLDALSTSSDESCSHSRTKDWLPSPGLRRNSTHDILTPLEDSAHHTTSAHHTFMSPINGAKSPIRSRSPDMENGAFDHRSLTPTIADLLSRVSGHSVSRSLTPEGLPRSRMHRSISALETYHRSSPLHLEIPDRSKSVLDKPSLPGQTPRRSQSLNFSDVTDGLTNVKEVHLYTLSTSTLLFHLLHSLWVASSLKQTLCEGKLKPIQHDFLQERDVDHEFVQLRTELLSSVTLEDQFSTLQELQQGASKYSTIRRLFWKDPNMLKTLKNLLKQYSKSSSGCRRRSLVEDDLQERQDELEVLAITLETLATCLQGTQRCPFKMKALQQNKNDFLRQLIAEIMTVPEVPATYKLTCSRWLTDFRDLSSNAWENLPESELLRLVQEVIHTSVGCLYELLASINELSWVANSNSQGPEMGPSLTTILQHAPVEKWLSYSVPQLLVLLQPERGGESNGSEASLTHQYCSVLNTLLHHSPPALHYCTTHFTEELRYYVQESVVSGRLGKAYYIRPHTLKLVRSLAQLVISKNLLRAR